MPIVKVNSLEKVSNRARALITLLFVVLLYSVAAVAQVSSSRPSPTPPPRPIEGILKSPDDESPLTTFEEELRAKRAIKMAEKDHQENLKRAQEIADIGKDLRNTLKNKSVLDRDSLKKVERLEKLTKKVRGEAGGEDEEISLSNRPSDFSSTVAQIGEASESLSKNVHDTPRQVVSASVICNANVLLELIRMLRTFARQP